MPQKIPGANALAGIERQGNFFVEDQDFQTLVITIRARTVSLAEGWGGAELLTSWEMSSPDGRFMLLLYSRKY